VRLTDVDVQVRNVDAGVQRRRAPPTDRQWNRVLITDFRVLIASRSGARRSAARLYKSSLRANVGPSRDGVTSELGRGARRCSSPPALSDCQRAHALCRRDIACAARFDEVGLRSSQCAVPDLTSGEAHRNGGNPIRFGDVDSGETRGLDICFSHSRSPGRIVDLGTGVDGEDAFKNQIDSSEAF
jgi:hypothetical protein